MKKRLIMICSLFCVIVMVCFTSAPAVSATPECCTLTLEYADGDAGALDGLHAFGLYLIAEGDQDGYRMTDEFAEKASEVAETNWDKAEEVAGLADVLTAHLAAEDVGPEDIQFVDEEGRAAFDNLCFGLYLVVDNHLPRTQCAYEVQQVLLWLPYVDPDGELDYSPVCTPKYEQLAGGSESLDISVEKVWVDDGNHPSSVTIQLLCGELVYDEVVLSEENGWKYRWEQLESTHDWQVAEKDIPEGYTAKVTQNGSAFTVTNTKKLPQTGQLWWPVTVMLGVGLPLLLLGFVLLQRGRKKASAAGGTGSEA